MSSTAVASPTVATPSATPVKNAKYVCPFPFTGDAREDKGTNYTLINKTDCFNFRQFVDSMEGFQLVVDEGEERGVVVWDRKIKGESMNQVKVFGTFTCKPEVLYAVLQDPHYRLEWDESREEGWPIARLDERQDISYYAGKSPVSGVSSREFLSQRAWHTTGDEYVIFSTAVNHADVPDGGKDGRVRALAKVTGYFVQPYGDGGCSLTYTTQMDPQGWIPSFVMNYITNKFAPRVIDNLRKASAGYEKWMAEQKDHKVSWSVESTPWEVDGGASLIAKTQTHVVEQWAVAKAKKQKK